MKLDLNRSALELHGDTARAIEVRVAGRRVLSLAADFAEPAADGVIRYPLPPAFGLTLRGCGELVVHAAGGGAELARAPVRSAVDPDGELRFTDAAGQAVVLNKWGHHSLTFADASAETVADLLRRTTEVFAQLTRFGLTPWIMGGTLLGPVRSGALLPHDDDADVGYVSAHENPADVALESYALQRFLEETGYTVIRYSATQMQILFPEEEGTEFHIDVFGGFYSGDMFMQPFHVRAPIPRDTFENLAEITIDGWPFAAPNPPERWLEANYGPSWRIPDAGHRFVTPPAAARRFDSWFGNTSQQVHFWDEHNQVNRDEPARPSAAARELLARAPRDATIYELAFGTGADLLHLAGAGHRVVGADFSPSAVAALTRRLGDAYPAVDLRQVDLGDRRQTLALAIAEARVVGPAHVFTANLLHVMTTDARRALVTLVNALLRRGGEWVVTFPTVPAPSLSNDDPTTWHLTVSQFRELVAAEPALEIRSVAVAGHTDRRIATVGVARKGGSS
ncbi:class I SAM-dependent methyltransferase [Cryobacterium lactosi]|nr:class I SAM-dependent methyltransferase [Cryobacterium lactosi]